MLANAITFRSVSATNEPLFLSARITGNLEVTHLMFVQGLSLAISF